MWYESAEERKIQSIDYNSIITVLKISQQRWW
jgi:hypothetical protein